MFNPVLCVFARFKQTMYKALYVWSHLRIKPMQQRRWRDESCQSGAGPLKRVIRLWSFVRPYVSVWWCHLQRSGILRVFVVLRSAYFIVVWRQMEDANWAVQSLGGSLIAQDTWLHWHSICGLPLPSKRTSIWLQVHADRVHTKFLSRQSLFHLNLRQTRLYPRDVPPYAFINQKFWTCEWKWDVSFVPFNTLMSF